MAHEGRCHCGKVTIHVPYAPGANPERPGITSCNCSWCRKVGGLMAYYPDPRDPEAEADSVTVAGETATYIWGDRAIAHHFCPTCGGYSHWTSTGESYGRIGVNARLLDGFAVEDGVATFDGKPLTVNIVDNAD